MNDVFFYIFVVEILPENAQIRPLFYFFIRFLIIQMLNSASHEVGVIAGPVAFQSDYGERYNLTPMPEIQEWE
jgi:hypothetical protein